MSLRTWRKSTAWRCSSSTFGARPTALAVMRHSEQGAQGIAMIEGRLCRECHTSNKC